MHRGDANNIGRVRLARRKLTATHLLDINVFILLGVHGGLLLLVFLSKLYHILYIVRSVDVD